jgi:FkbM family methyltransferase
MNSLIYFIFRMIHRLFQILPGGHSLSGSRMVTGIYNHLTRMFRRKVVKIFGNTMYLDPEDNLELSLKGVHEPLTTRIFQKEINPGDTVLDIGAHIGYYTLISAKIVREHGRVFSFEANPSNYAILKKNIEVNGYHNVIAIQKAISNFQGNTKLFFEKSSNTRWSSIYNIHGEGKFIEVDVSTIDEILKDYTGRVDFIKLDIEGAEMAALRGMNNILKNNRKIKIVIEFRPSILLRVGIVPREFLDFFTTKGFKIYYADEVHGEILPAEPDDIIKFCDEYLATNLLCEREL